MGIRVTFQPGIFLYGRKVIELVSPKNIRLQTRIKYLDFHNIVMILLLSQGGGILLTRSKTMNPTIVL
jgi:hypothetical protein